MLKSRFGVLFLCASTLLNAAETVDFTVTLETVMKHDDGKFLWFHPRAAPIPGGVVMTIQKHLKVSDYYSGLHFMRREGVDGAWSGPTLPPEIDWQPQADGVTISVADVTPGWHEKTGKLLAVGCRVRYSPKGKQLDDVKRAHQTVYAVFDPKTSEWTPWQILELPEGEEFNFARNACSQWVVKNDGKLLVPLYIGKSAKDRFSTTVAECSFDGKKLVYERNGNVLRLDVARGLYEPSLIALGNRYYLTLRNDVGGYVSSSDDGLHFAEPKPWTFDDGAELGSYNTQQHWLTHADGLFLIYTRRGANNDHIIRHRAPLIMARVDPEKLKIIRASEKVIVPERGAELGNFGCVRISDDESWVTVSEGMFMKDSAKRGAEGATFVARILWSKPQAEPDWKLEGTAAWQARDSQAEWVFKDRLWIGGGWFQSYADPPRDIWSSGDGKAWDLIEKSAPWQHSDLPMNVTFADKMWIMGGWYKGRLPGHSASHQVWSSGDGVKWEQVTANAGWSPRLAAGLVEHRGRMWMLGGTEDYYFGNESNLKNDVWSSADGKAWKLETANAAWSPRAYHQAVVLNDKIYVLGGGNYVPSYHAKNDVWSSSDGVNWTCETESAPWGPRLWFSAAVYRGRIWVVGGWSKEKDNYGDVWHSADGKNWQRLDTKTSWKARHEHSLFVFRDKLWLAGGHARPLSSEVWSLALPTDWRPTITLPLRIHLMQSDSAPAMQTTLLEADVKRILGKVNTIWSQAGIQFEMESATPTRAIPLPPEMRLKSELDRIHSMIPKESLSSNAIDVCYVKQMQPNGFFSGEPIVVKDTAKLREVPGGLDEPLPRVTSHEIGHALGLSHRQQNTNLMQSGTTGFELSETEIQTARVKAAEILTRFQTMNTGTVSKPSLSQ